MTDFIPHQTHTQYTQSTTMVDSTGGGSNMQGLELAAFEKGRLQGEMEAIRRMESEGGLKQMGGVSEPVRTVPQPDVLEINRLTWLQRTAAVLGELGAIGMVVLTAVFISEYMLGYDWTNDSDDGNQGMWNAHLLCLSIGLFCSTQALLMYRILPLNLNANINRGIYIFWQVLALTAYWFALAGMVMSSADSNWAGYQWVFYFAIGLYTLHALYSMGRTIMEGVAPVKYEDWAEVNNSLTATPEQRRDRSLANDAGRTLYTPAPVAVHHGANLPHANANVGAQVPVAPPNAPRWAETPRTHSEDYFLVPRKKWAVVSYFAMGTYFLLAIIVQQVWNAASANMISTLVAGPDAAPSPVIGTNGHLLLSENDTMHDVISALCLVTIFTLCAISYAAMPPRTTLVKNGLIREADRRASISHNAETRTGPSMV